jgi:16S rRNA processing protein RimM
VATEEPPGVTVARILRPHGRRGEVAAEILTDFPERLKTLKFASLWDGSNPARRVAVRSCWLSQSRGGQAIFHFDGSNSISDAEKLAGLEVQIPLSDRVQLPAGSYFVTDLIGCEVREKSGARIGEVRDVQFTGENVAGTPVLVVNSMKGELLIPLAQEICVHIDTATRAVEVVLPEGLRDLNE